MAETPLIDLKALLLEREDFEGGHVGKLREGLAQGGTQFRTLREVNDALRKKLESAAPAHAKKLHLKLGIVNFFLGYTPRAAEHLGQAEGALAAFYHGRALAGLQRWDEALGAFEKAEKSGYSAATVQLQRAGILRQKGDTSGAKTVLEKNRELATHNAEFHYQMARVHQSEGNRLGMLESLEKAVSLDPSHTGALFELAYANDLAGNDDEAIGYYERCLKYPPLHKGAVNNLGVLYEDNERFDKAAECYNRLLKADYNDERARLFLKDAQAALTSTYDPEEEQNSDAYRAVLEIPITDFELSVRSRNTLKKLNIRTLGDLTRVTEQSLLNSKNFGETSLDEIKAIMTTKGLRIGQALEQGIQYEVRYRPSHQNLSAEEQAVLGKPVSELNLSVRARKCMARLNLNTLGELVQRTADDLLEAKNFGMTSLSEVREKLQAYGLKLRGD